MSVQTVQPSCAYNFRGPHSEKYRKSASDSANVVLNFSTRQIANTIHDATKPIEIHEVIFFRDVHRRALLNSSKVTDTRSLPASVSNRSPHL